MDMLVVLLLEVELHSFGRNIGESKPVRFDQSNAATSAASMVLEHCVLANSIPEVRGCRVPSSDSFGLLLATFGLCDHRNSELSL